LYGLAIPLDGSGIWTTPFAQAGAAMMDSKASKRRLARIIEVMAMGDMILDSLMC
jgi:hypothetical protein